MAEGPAPPTRAAAHSHETIRRRPRIQHASPHMCGANQPRTTVLSTAAKPANNTLPRIEPIQRPEPSTRRHKPGSTDQSTPSNDDKTRSTCVHRPMTTGHSQNICRKVPDDAVPHTWQSKLDCSLTSNPLQGAMHAPWMTLKWTRRWARSPDVKLRPDHTLSQSTDKSRSDNSPLQTVSTERGPATQSTILPYIKETDGRPADGAIQSRTGREETEEDQGTPHAPRAERNWRKTKHADAGRQNLALNARNEQRPWSSYISPHVFTPKEDQEGWTNGRFPHTKSKLRHKGALPQNLKGPPIRRPTALQTSIELATTGPNPQLSPFLPAPANKTSWSPSGSTPSASITLHETADRGPTQPWRAPSWNDQQHNSKLGTASPPALPGRCNAASPTPGHPSFQTNSETMELISPKQPGGGESGSTEKKKLNRGNKFISTVEIPPWRETPRFFHLWMSFLILTKMLLKLSLAILWMFLYMVMPK